MRPDRQTMETLFEGAPSFVERLLAEDASAWDELFDRAEAVAQEMPDDEQAELLNAHPRIGAAPSSMSDMAFREQGFDTDPGTASLQERLDRLNEAYEKRHGFRFVIFVNGRSRAQIAELMPDHIDVPTDLEKERGLHDVVAIARSRFERMREERSG